MVSTIKILKCYNSLRRKVARHPPKVPACTWRWRQTLSPSSARQVPACSCTFFAPLRSRRQMLNTRNLNSPRESLHLRADLSWFQSQTSRPQILISLGASSVHRCYLNGFISVFVKVPGNSQSVFEDGEEGLYEFWSSRIDSPWDK